jgi:hypothetical protein
MKTEAADEMPLPPERGTQKQTPHSAENLADPHSNLISDGF